MTTVGLAAVDEAVDPADEWREQVHIAVTTYFDLLAVDPMLTVAWSRDLAGLGPAGVAVQQEGVDRYAELVLRISRGEAMRRAGVRPMSADLAVMLVAGINAMVVRAIERGDDDLSGLAPIAVHLVIAALNP
ncbi:hypothetical protein [Williamsia soli]|uniref:hypothetical protein n=1 Tax=Williamsia soli TaxID=364929 RepID=UPI001F446A0C|nr:hypothetical protein [Williamsia soli]